MENQSENKTGISALSEMIPLSPGVSVVELGCGNGRDIVLAARQIGEQGRVLGTDASPEMIELADRSVAEAGFLDRDITLKVVEPGTLPHPKNFADVLLVNCIDTVCPPRVIMLQNIFRIMRPGGQLIVTDIVGDRQEDSGDPMSEQAYFNILRCMSFMEVELLAKYRSDKANNSVVVFSALKPPLNC